MNGKERILNTFNLQKTDRTPWVPFVGCHGAKLIGVNAKKYLNSSELLIQGIKKAIELYKPDGIPVIFDLQVEAEILGCDLVWADNNPPAVVGHPLLQGVNLEDLSLPTKSDGRIPQIIAATKTIKNLYPGVALYGLITGPFTLSLHLLGPDIFLKMFESPETINKIVGFCNEVAIRMADIYMEAGCDVIAVVDPMTSQIDPGSFESFVKEPLTMVFTHIRNANKLSSFFVCGNAQQNIELMCSCKPANISIDENIPLDYVKDAALQKNISFGGNLKLTSVLLMGSKDENYSHTVETIDIGGDSGFVLSPGCDLPMDTPPDNLIAVSEIISDPYKQEIARNLKKVNNDIKPIDLSDRWKSDKVVIDVVTLDSGSCAPCQYMYEAVKLALKDFVGSVELNEFKIKEDVGLQMMSALGVKNIPTICMNGHVEFVSQIPPHTDIIKRIEKHLKNK